MWPSAAYNWTNENNSHLCNFNTLIDVIFTNCPDRIVCSGVRRISISDHSIVFAYSKLSINETSRGHNVITYRNVRKFNRENFRNDVASQSWDQIYFSTNPNDMWCRGFTSNSLAERRGTRYLSLHLVQCSLIFTGALMSCFSLQHHLTNSARQLTVTNLNYSLLCAKHWQLI